MILVKNVEFLLRLFFSERGLDMMLDVIPRKEGFLDDKNVVYHSQKISSFQRG